MTASEPLLLQPQGAVAPVYYRPLQPKDFVHLKAAHAALFPIDYDDGFFNKATNALDRIWSCAAFSIGPYGEEQLAGFITAKTVCLHECDTADRHHMGLLSPIVDHDRILYILTLGVMDGFRHQGIASTLIQMVGQHAWETRCRAVFLHVITYNTAAMGLYTRAGFSCLARLPNFYHIATGRQPNPSIVVYDAYLYVLFHGAPGGVVTPWDMLNLAWTPVRSALGKIHSCMPGFCRQQKLHQYPFAPPPSPGGIPALPATDSNGNSIKPDSSGGATASSYQVHNSSDGSQQQHQQPQQQLQLPPPQQPHYQQQQQPVYSRYRFRKGSFASHAAADHTKQHQQQVHSVQQQQQQHWQQQRQWSRSQQQQLQPHQQYQQQVQPPQQRMLRWLFSGHNRGATGGHQWQPGPQLQQQNGYDTLGQHAQQQQQQFSSQQLHHEIHVLAHGI